jgi:preprotein translocase subunit SecE
VARNRKRRSERRPSRPVDGPTSQPGVATANGAHHDESPDPIEHATPDVELAEAQLAVGRPELADVQQGDAETAEAADELTEEEFEREEDFVDGGGGSGRGGGGSGRGSDDSDSGGGAPESGRGGELAAGSAPVPAHRPGLVMRLVHFLQGSWRELQRVQWPDRRQVMQATGVVIGFVIVAGVYLGLADWVAGKVVPFILK